MDRKLRTLQALLGGIFARITFARYVLASVCALCADMILFLTLVRTGLSPSLAAFCGYSVGLVLHWMLSIRFVFMKDGRATNWQWLAFVLSAVLGLGMTVATVTVLCGIGLAPAMAKLLAIPTSFLAVYAIRRYGIFARV